MDFNLKHGILNTNKTNKAGGHFEYFSYIYLYFKYIFNCFILIKILKI